MLEIIIVTRGVSHKSSKESQSLVLGHPEPLPSPDRSGPVPVILGIFLVGAPKDWDAKDRSARRAVMECMIFEKPVTEKTLIEDCN
jgi:hypothetical protein